MSTDWCVLVAPDKFKGTVTARTVAQALKRGKLASAPLAEVIQQPIADGGDGTVDVLRAAGYGTITVRSANALRHPASTAVATRGSHAFIEMASTCGIAGMNQPDPLAASSFGLGVALREVLDRGFRHITMGLGGSASTDGGLGMAVALGAQGFTHDGRYVTPDGHGLLELDTLDVSRIELPADLTMRIACDVRAPLHGPTGAAHVFAPQKGANADQVSALEKALVRLGSILKVACQQDPSEVPGAGAAGGTGAMAIAALGASVIDGATFVLDTVGIPDVLDQCTLVVTGEGSWDAQSLMGKGPGRIVSLAHEHGRPTVVVAGRIAEDSRHAEGVVEYWSLEDNAGSIERALQDAEVLLEVAGTHIGHRLTAHASKNSNAPA